MKTDQEISQLLFDTGHMNCPRGCKTHDFARYNLPSDFGDRHVKEAIASYQDFMSHDLDRLCLKHHLRPAQADGRVGPATRELFEQDRCGCPDYGEAHEYSLPKTGDGNWKGCHGIGDFHAAKVHIDDSLMPGFLKDVFDQVWDGTVGAYQAVGLQLIRTQSKTEANIRASFVRRGSGWIGLAQMGYGQTCRDNIWCQYSAAFNPSKTVRLWIGLFLHEIAHNCGIGHTRTGHMSPSIQDLTPTWENDSSRPILARKFGGEPILPGPPKAEYWVQHGKKSNKGNELWVPYYPPVLRIPEDEHYA